MNLRLRFSSWAWLVVALGACGYVAWAAAARAQRVAYATNLVGDRMTVDAASPSGYAGGMRRMLLPQHDRDSYGWIAQTQLMLARREWRVRHIDYENAPFGHDVSAASPYRWWLGLMAWFDRVRSGRPSGLSVERAALFADPLLQALFLIGSAIFVAWRFGGPAAALLSVGLVSLFPFSVEFLPGLPDDRGLAHACAFGSVLLLLAGMGAGNAGSAPAERPTRAWFGFAGVAGGLGMWLNVSIQGPIVGGIFAGALLAAWAARPRPNEPGAAVRIALPWRTWALSGAATTLAAYLVEYFPAHLGAWQLEAVHPLYGLAWLGGGELLALAVAWIGGEKPAWGLRGVGRVVLAAAAFSALPVVMGKTHHLAFLTADLASSRLTRLPDSDRAAGVADWLVQYGITPTFWATVLPLGLVLPAVWMLVRRQSAPGHRAALALALGPVAVTGGYACWQLGWWNAFDAMLLVLLIATVAVAREASLPRPLHWAWRGLVALVLALGAVQTVPPAGAAARGALKESEVNELTARDFAHWLARQVGPAGAVVLAPPDETASLCYYGGLRGLTTLDRENPDGFVAAARIASATTAEEAQELIRRRQVTHVIIPSWDTYLDSYARWGLGQVEGSFIDGLHHWGLPPWLRPVPYQFPDIPGFEKQSVTVLEVVDDQDDAVAMSRMAEYFVEMGRLDLAATMGQNLRRFPANPGALVARAQVASAQGDQAGFTQALDLLQSLLSRGADRSLPWDRRVSLAIVLARGKRVDQARDQVRRCVTDLTEPRVRSLSTGALYNLQVLSHAFGIPIADPKLNGLALDLLPDDLRGRL